MIPSSTISQESQENINVCTLAADAVAENLIPDLSMSQAFLTQLDPDGQFSFQTFDDSKSKRGALAHVLHGSLDANVELLSALAAEGAGVFVTVNATDGKGRKAENVTRVRAIFVDLDGSPLEPVLTTYARHSSKVATPPQFRHTRVQMLAITLSQPTPNQNR